MRPTTSDPIADAQADARLPPTRRASWRSSPLLPTSRAEGRRS